MGGQVALALARHYPERVGALVLVGPTDGNELIPLWRMGVGLLMDFATEPLLYSSVLLRTFFQMGIPRYLGTVPKMSADKPLTHAKEVEVPTLILRGTRDGIISERAARALAEALPYGNFQAVEGSAHAVQFHYPKVFSRLALAFWEQADSLFVGLQGKLGYVADQRVVGR